MQGRCGAYLFCRPVAVIDIGVQHLAPMTRALIAAPGADESSNLGPIGAVLLDSLDESLVLLGRPGALDLAARQAVPPALATVLVGAAGDMLGQFAPEEWPSIVQL